MSRSLGGSKGGALGLLEERRTAFPFLESDPVSYTVHSLAYSPQWMNYPRGIMKYVKYWIEKNEYIREKMDTQDTVLNDINQKQLIWYGHVERMNPTRLPKVPEEPEKMGYTECPGANVPDFGRMFLTLKYTDITQNTYIRS